MQTDWDHEPTDEYETLQRKHVLVAEDDPELRELVVARLQREGCEVVAVGTGDEALDRLANDTAGPRPELAILDVRMPGMSGLEIVYVLRMWSRVVPILLVTAFPDPELLDECARLGVPVLQKPFSLHRLGGAALAVMRGVELEQ